MNTKKHILVADDDHAIGDALQAMLEDTGYCVTTTTDGKNVEQLQKNFPDLILLDIWMSGMDGREICKRFKSQITTKHIPIIMISANTNGEKIAKEAGANDFVAKPFEINDLLAKIEKHLT